MSTSYSVVADMQAAGWIVERQGSTVWSATKQNVDNPSSPVHIHASSLAGLVNAADALRSHRESRSLHI